MVLRRCHISDLKFGIWFLLRKETARKNKFSTIRKWKPDRYDHVGAAKYSFLI